MGHVVAHKAMEIAIQKATEHGIGWVSVKDSGHFGVAGFFPMMALKKDFIGYTVSNSAPMMAPWGGRERIIGNNPVSYAFPADKYLPVILDFSCSVVSSGKLILCRKKGVLKLRDVVEFLHFTKVLSHDRSLLWLGRPD
jgi:LDH2 family malate/lactate/ureidoglycolate dehydrogenase